MSQPYLSNIAVANINQQTKEFLGVTPIKLPESNADQRLEGAEIRSFPFTIDTALCLSLKSLAREHDVELSMLFMAALNVLLQRHTALEELLVADISSKQNHEGHSFETSKHSLFGVRSQFNSNTTFTMLVQLLKNKYSEAGEAGNPSFFSLQNNVTDPYIDLEVFQTLFVFKDDYGTNEENGQFAQKGLWELFELFKNFYIALTIQHAPGSIDAAFYYDNKQLSEHMMARFADHFVNLLQAIVKAPGERIGAYQILTPEEWKAIIVDFNDTAAPYPRERTIHSLFEEQAINYLEHVALCKGVTVITYGELNKQANRLAHLLIDSGVSPGDNIGLLVTRGFEMITGMLAIMKAGGAYVPIDPDYPIERQEYIYNQSLLKMVVADNDYPLKTLLDKKAFIKINLNELDKFAETNPSLNTSGSQLAYTIYTSGSTGKPKGVMIAHHSAVNLILWVNRQFSVGRDDRLLFITSMCFDLSVYDIFGILAAGGTLVIAEQREIKDVKLLQNMLVDNRITFWDSVPTTMDYLVKNLELENPGYRFDGLKTVFLSGDWIPVNLPGRIKQFFPGADVISLGGATEGTVWSNFFPVKETPASWKSIPYGRPITNNFFYILNEQLQPVPLNVTGDLYIGGAGVAKGYANEPEKTKSAFIADPFNISLGGIMYKTGDLGRMLPDMNMEFIGRKDNQVKIQGFRVELGEIESILNHSGPGGWCCCAGKR